MGHIIKRYTKIPITTSNSIKLPDEQRPKVVIAEGNKTSIEYNSSFKLTCKVTAYPKPKITWYNQKGVSLPSKSSMINHPTDYISYLEIAIAVNDRYMCHAVNDAGMGNARITVNVMSPLTASNTIRNVKVEYGKSKVLKCEIESKFPKKTNWYHKNEISGEKNKVIDSDDYSLSADKTELTINKMDSHLEGTYICSAYLVNNKSIRKESTVGVQMTGSAVPKVDIPKVDITKVDIPKIDKPKVDIPKIDKPKVDIDKLDYVRTVKGTTAVLKCKLTGIPKSAIAWQFGGKSGSKFEPLGETGSVLRINNVEAKHEGQYKCVAKMGIHEDEKVTTLIVQDIPKILSRRSIIYQAFEGDADLKIPCVAVGEPKPIITWKVDGRPIAVPNSKYVVEDGALVIKYPKLADTKSYACVATNAIGSETATFKTIIRQKPELLGVDPKKTNLGKSVGKTCSAKPRVKTTWFANRPNGEHAKKFKNKKETLSSLQVCEKK
ncbi:roundabout homolog 1-like [Spodoptera litura]|uniref:Roundabout homolog 1-like n=1 Tax=Spodoptera litura TaxID=69820 RepID=A0A9J7E7T9_SPOLT|nr:roundabout homolog 1-like [Spodoptera litura]